MAESVSSLPRRQDLPAEVSINPGMAFSPNEMRQLKALTGRSLNELLGGDENDLEMAPDRMQALIWVQLRREGYDASWDDAGDILPRVVTPDPDPTLTGGSPSSPPSAATGA